MKELILIITACLILSVSGCQKLNTNRESDSDVTGDVCIEFYTDKETGVEYVIYNAPYRGGICPRYNADGSLYVREEESK